MTARLSGLSSVDVPRGLRGSRRGRRLRGFTLLEMIAVVAVLAGIAVVTADMLQEDTGQFRYTDTRNRLEDIRRAVIGRPDWTVNGQPIVTGYASDMGRLPANVRELVEQGSQTAWTVDATTGVGHGWRGPYLSVFREMIDDDVSGVPERAFRDGWGNRTESGAGDIFGWKIFDASTDSLIVQSYGSDGNPNPSDVAEYAAQSFFVRDYPPPPDPGTDPTANPDALIPEAAYEVDISTISVRFRNRTGVDAPATATNICLRLYYPDNGTPGEAESVFSPGISLATIAAGEDSPVIDFTFTTPTTITAGPRALRVVEEDGDCDDANIELANSGGYNRVLFLAPGPLPVIDWILSP